MTETSIELKKKIKVPRFQPRLRVYSGARTQEPALFQSSSGDSDAHPGLGQPQLQRKVGTPSHRLACQAHDTNKELWEFKKGRG